MRILAQHGYNLQHSHKIMAKKVYTKKTFLDDLIVPTVAGTLPGGAQDDGDLKVDTTNDAIYFYSGGAWNQAGAGGPSGEDYIDVNSTNLPPAAQGAESVAIGPNAISKVKYDIAIGYNAYAYGEDFGIGGGSVTIGYGAFNSAGSAQCITIGKFAGTFNDYNVAIGYNPVAISPNSVAIGKFAFTGGFGPQGPNARQHEIAIGYGANSSFVGSIAMGYSALSYVSSVAIGFYSKAESLGSICIGKNTSNGSQQNQSPQSVLIGYGANCIGSTRSVHIGYNASSNGATRAVIIGANANAVGNDFNSVVIGADSTVQDVNCAIVGPQNVGDCIRGVVLGYNNTVGGTFFGATAIGNGINATFSAIGIGSNMTVAGTGVITMGNTVNVGSSGAKNIIAIGDDNTVTGDFSVNLGRAITNPEAYSVAIGDAASIAAGAAKAIVIGNDAAATAAADGGVAIGYKTTSKSKFSIAIGYQVDNFNDRGVQIGSLITTSSARTNVLGYYHVVNSAFSTVLGSENVVNAGTALTSSQTNILGFQNTQTGCRQTVVIGEMNVMTYGHDVFQAGEDNTFIGYKGAVADVNMFNVVQIGHQNSINNIVAQDDLGDRVQIGSFNVNGTGLATTGGSDSVQVGSQCVMGDGSHFGINIGHTATIGANSQKAVAIGHQASIAGSAQYSVAIGYKGAANGNSSISIGYQATVTVANAVQIGTGTNSLTQTLQYLSNPIANVYGTEVNAAAGAPTSTARNGTLYLDTTGNGTLYCYNNSAWRIVQALP